MITHIIYFTFVLLDSSSVGLELLLTIISTSKLFDFFDFLFFFNKASLLLIGLDRFFPVPDLLSAVALFFLPPNGDFLPFKEYETLSSSEDLGTSR